MENNTNSVTVTLTDSEAELVKRCLYIQYGELASRQYTDRNVDSASHAALLAQLLTVVKKFKLD